MDKNGEQLATEPTKLAVFWRSRAWAYGFAVLAAVVSLIARKSMTQWVDDHYVLVAFCIPVIISAYIGGLGPGLLATAIVAVGADYYFIPPIDRIFPFERGVDFGEWLFLISSGIIASVLNEALHRARRRAKASEQLYAVTLASIGDAVITTDNAGRVTFLNGEAERLTGWPKADALGRPLPQIFHIINEATRALVENPVVKVFRTGSVVGLANHTVLVARDGREFIIDDSGAPIRNGAGEIIGVVLVFRDNTEKKHAEEAVRESQALYHSLVEQLPAGIFRKDAAGRYVFVNKYFCDLRHATPELFLGKLPAELPLAEDPFKAEAASHHEQIMQTGRPVTVMDEYHRADGETLYFQVVKSPVFNAEGKVTGSQGILFDVTERKRAAEKTAREQARFKLVFDTLPIGIAFHTTHPDGRFTRAVNDAHLRISGLTRAQHDEPDIYNQITHPEDRAAQQRFREQVRAGTIKQYAMEKRYVHPDGKIVWVNFSFQRETYPDGTIEELTTVVDISERKTAEQQQMQLAVIVESSRDAIISKSLAGIITSWNRGAEIIFGYAAAETIGQTMLMLFPPEQKNEEAAILARVGRGESVEHFETERIRKDGTRIRIAATVSPLRDSQGTIIGASTIARDITLQHNLQEQLRQSQKMEAIGQLAGGVAHDFNNILAIIQMQAELAKTEPGVSPELAGCIEEIQVAANRAANLTRQLLLFSRRQQLRPRELDLSDSITGMTKMLRRILGEDILMLFKYAPQPLFILADAGMMDQVLMNLTVNSRDAMPGGGQLIIETTAVEFDELAAAQSAQARAGAFVRLSVSDTGCGIPADILPRIFEPFFTTKEVGKGTGLGLATVFSIVQQHQGWINVYTEPGHGTTFHIYLPRLTKTSPRQAVVQAALTAATGGTETILLVEDDPALRASMHKAIAQLGYQVLAAHNGVDALQLWRQHRDEIHLVLTDLVMPGGMNGKELGRQLLRENPKLKIIYASGYSAEVAGRDFPLEEGVNFLAKPFPAQRLAQTIRNRLDRA